MSNESATPTPAVNRFMREVRADESLRVTGYALIVVSVLVLSSPGQRWLFASDGLRVDPRLVPFFEQARLAAGALGLALLALSRARVFAGRVIARAGDLTLLTVAVFLAVTGSEAWTRVQAACWWGSALHTPPRLDALRDPREVPLRPGVFADWVVSEFDPAYRRTAFFTVNRFGLRGVGTPAETPGPRPRILCLGGSTTFGMSVTDGLEWPARLEAHLGGRVEVVNAGRPGATSCVNYQYLRDRLVRLRPDVVVLYEGFNDLWKGVRRHAGEQPDYTRVDETMPAVPDALDRGENLPWPSPPSFFLYRTAWWLRGRLPPPAPTWPEPPPLHGDFRFDPAIVGMFEHNLAAEIRLSRRHGAVPLVATMAGCDDPAVPAPEQARRMAYVLARMPQLDVRSGQTGLDLYREATRRVARQESARLVDLARTIPKDTSAYTDTIHFTPAGEDLVAREIAAALAGEIDAVASRRPEASAPH